MALKVITPPSGEPITKEQVFASARVDGSEFDTSINIAIKALRLYGEARTGRKFMLTELELTLDRFPCGRLNLFLPDVQEVTEVQYLDVDGVSQVLDDSAYQLVGGEPCGLVPAYQTCWPETRCMPEVVCIKFKAGFGAAAADVPEDIQQWLIARCVQLVQNPDGLGGEVKELPFLDGLLDPYTSKAVF